MELSHFPLEPFPGQLVQTRLWQEMWSQAAKFSRHALQNSCKIKLNLLGFTHKKDVYDLFVRTVNKHPLVCGKTSKRQNHYRPQRNCGKVIFSQASVSHSV